MSVLTAIAEGNASGLLAALNDGETPHATDVEGVPAILHAADTGRIDLVQALLEAGARIDAVDSIGWSPLMAAVAQGATQLVGFLLTHGANANHVGREDTPLTIAVSDSTVQVVTLLLNHGADPRLRRPDGWTPLMLAAFMGDLNRIRLLLEHGADPTITMGARLTDAATVAAAHGHHTARDLLLDAARSAAPDLTALWGSLQRWCETHAPELCGAFENTVGNAPSLPDTWPQLPPDAHQQLTNWAGGLPFYDYRSLAAEQATSVWQDHARKAADGGYMGRQAAALGVDEPVVRQYWCDAWIPIARDGEGNLLLVDMAPADTGVPGQLVSWSVEQGPIAVLASGITPYLQHLVSRARRGRVRFDKRTGSLYPA
ncbi:MAG: ankyrin repeat domain-containing protein [Alphaproteobacteria bacterium]|nr:ankyrin repeat domain-containing protein [Alphaproteobacteria bacterium]MCB9691740.1 ankyrin repeat domain-containing protein [Alphaproteobacteria bacterium]